ncbi:MAG: glycoside hydrolase family 31 protein [Asgard group archaeon]|nr:glycoside hydrolase family 31 protein [Asgard group archaeon]
MSKESKDFNSKLNIYLASIVLKLTVPLLNNRIIPLRWKKIGGIVSSKESRNLILIECETGFLEIKLITPSVWRIRASKNKLPGEHTSFAAKEPITTTDSIRIVKEYGRIIIKENKNVLRSNDVIIKINENDSSISFERINGEVLHIDNKSIAWSKNGSWARCQKFYPKKVYHIGFGEKTGNLVKNGKKMIFWNTDQTSYGKNDDPLYQSEPIQISILDDGTAHAIFYDNHHYSVIKPERDRGEVVKYYTEREPLCYYVFAGPTLKDVSKQISELNGRIPFPPRWALGHHQCRWSYYPEEQVLDIARKFRNKNIPCDSIHLDIDYMQGYRCFTWDKKRFPNPEKMVSDLKSDGFKLITMIDPALKVDPKWEIYNECISKKYQCLLPNEESYIGKVWPGKCIFPDYTNPEVRKWWGSLYKKMLDIGIEGIWLDMAEPSTFDFRRTAPDKVQHDLDGKKGDHRDAHNIYGLKFAQATREGLDKLRGNYRNFLFVRAAYAGIQRYASSWTGDNRSNWIGLQQSIPMIINMGLTGQTFVAVDLGGFSFDCNPELLTRWYELGIFYPFCRNHSSKITKKQEPWAFGEETETIIRKTIELRYQFLPYLYTVLYEAVIEGLPMMRPLFMEYPLDKETYNEEWHNTQFLVGDKLLVAPILTKRKTKHEANREIYLPKGKWIDFWSGNIINGGQILQREVGLDQIPLFIKSGSVIPMGPIIPYVEKSVDYPIFLNVYPDTEIIGSVYFDDGITKEYENNQFNHLTISGNETTHEINLDISQRGELKDLPFTNNILYFRIFTQKQPFDVRVNDRKAKSQFEENELSWKLDSVNNTIHISVPNPEFPLSVQIRCSL